MKCPTRSERSGCLVEEKQDAGQRGGNENGEMEWFLCGVDSLARKWVNTGVTRKQYRRAHGALHARPGSILLGLWPTCEAEKAKKALEWARFCPVKSVALRSGQSRAGQF
jgi:hypothetical protein